MDKTMHVLVRHPLGLSTFFIPIFIHSNSSIYNRKLERFHSEKMLMGLSPLCTMRYNVVLSLGPMILIKSCALLLFMVRKFHMLPERKYNSMTLTWCRFCAWLCYQFEQANACHVSGHSDHYIKVKPSRKSIYCAAEIRGFFNTLDMQHAPATVICKSQREKCCWDVRACRIFNQSRLLATSVIQDLKHRCYSVIYLKIQTLDTVITTSLKYSSAYYEKLFPCFYVNQMITYHTSKRWYSGLIWPSKW